VLNIVGHHRKHGANEVEAKVAVMKRYESDFFTRTF
jgi:hypothetical protein